MLKKDEIFAIWEEPKSPWSQWVKPVLFAFMEYELPPASPMTVTADLDWVPAPQAGAALVVDLPGAEGAHVATELARRGYRPIPLYNALPFPIITAHIARRAVDVSSILAAMRAATDVLQQLQLPAGAPPAFLLDANRRTAEFKLSVGDFDNRSICFSTDFPSAQLLNEKGIRSAVVVEREREPDQDLARVLAGWQAGGITLMRKDLANAAAPGPLRIKPPRWWQAVWYWLTVRLGLRGSSLGGFGAIIEPTGG
ncbi:MAG TPA: hypothetical protein VJN48_02230 [Terriglobales bacterium]|nr:hypothetical protein [Terriglobales bacterium]